MIWIEVEDKMEEVEVKLGGGMWGIIDEYLLRKGGIV
jgi:hypothetical protein